MRVRVRALRKFSVRSALGLRIRGRANVTHRFRVGVRVMVRVRVRGRVRVRVSVTVMVTVMVTVRVRVCLGVELGLWGYGYSCGSG